RRSNTGWRTPVALIESASSLSEASSNLERGWNGLGAIRSTAISLVPARLPSIVSVDAPGSGASKPLPSAFLGMAHHLRRERAIAFGPTALRVVENDRLPERWGLAQADISRNRGLVDPLREELPRLVCHLLGQVQASVEHSQQNPLYPQARVQ